MENFIIQPTSQMVVDNNTNQVRSMPVLTHRITAFYHSDYHGGSSEQRDTSGTVENVICTLKNQFHDKAPNVLQIAAEQLTNMLLADLPQILRQVGKNNLTVCVIPRAKVNYSPNQRLFNTTVSNVVNGLANFHNGTNYIIRHTDTRTTHMNRSGYGGEGEMPYPGITKDTCTISDEVRGKDILLIDDLYTKTVNIDEDAIQALFDKGANSVVFYSLGKTVSR